MTNKEKEAISNRIKEKSEKLKNIKQNFSLNKEAQDKVKKLTASRIDEKLNRIYVAKEALLARQLEVKLESAKKEIERLTEVIAKKEEDLVNIEENISKASLSRKIKEYFSAREVKTLVTRLKKQAKTDKKVAMFLAEQVFGKARGNVGVDGGEDGKPIQMNMATILNQLERPKQTPIQGVVITNKIDPVSIAIGEAVS